MPPHREPLRLGLISSSLLLMVNSCCCFRIAVDVAALLVDLKFQ